VELVVSLQEFTASEVTIHGGTEMQEMRMLLLLLLLLQPMIIEMSF